MFARLRRKPKLNESTVDYLCRLRPGQVLVESNFVKVYLADVDTMCTTYAKTKGMSKEDILELVKSGLAIERHHQIYL
jgi:hypothetical protein